MNTAILEAGAQGFEVLAVGAVIFVVLLCGAIARAIADEKRADEARERRR